MTIIIMMRDSFLLLLVTSLHRRNGDFMETLWRAYGDSYGDGGESPRCLQQPPMLSNALQCSP